jgi:nitrogenase molybdenum-iron protein beta chain
MLRPAKARAANDAAAFHAASGAVEQVRHGCALGALLGVIAIPGAVPITHCGPGCAQKQFHALSGISGYQGGEFHVPSTNIGNREVIFGGADRLDELIGATLKVMEADLWVVQTGCIPGLVGDDVEAVVGRWRRKGVPIVFAETTGYRGTNFTGHETVVKAIVDQFVGPATAPRRERLVNVWASLPYQNPFWRGDLSELKRLLEGIGLEVDILFGPASEGVAEWKRIPEARFNLVVSPWLGLGIARHLEATLDQPFLHLPRLPIGARATRTFLETVAAFAGIAPSAVQAFVAREEREHWLYLRDFSAFYAGCASQYRLPSQVHVAADSASALAIAGFMVDQLGLNPGAIVVTENPPEDLRDTIRAAFRGLADGVDAEVSFAEDGPAIHRLIRDHDRHGEYPILFGTTWENGLARDIGAPLVEIGYPATDEVVLSRTHVGWRGALTLIEHVYTTVVRASTLSGGGD